MFSMHSFHIFDLHSIFSDLLSVVNSLILSINEIDLHLVKLGPCNASCNRFLLVKLLRLSGYDAAVCASKWQGSGKVPGGDAVVNVYINHEKKFAFVEMRSVEEASNAMALDGQYLVFYNVTMLS